MGNRKPFLRIKKRSHLTRNKSLYGTTGTTDKNLPFNGGEEVLVPESSEPFYRWDGRGDPVYDDHGNTGTGGTSRGRSKTWGGLLSEESRTDSTSNLDGPSVTVTLVGSRLSSAFNLRFVSKKLGVHPAETPHKVWSHFTGSLYRVTLPRGQRVSLPSSRET